jgi:hypothetical protein
MGGNLIMTILLSENLKLKIKESDSDYFELSLIQNGEKFQIPQIGDLMNVKKNHLNSSISFISRQLEKRGITL